MKEKCYFCSGKQRKTKKMDMLNAYYYGYYLYFAGNCEAEGPK